MPFWKPVQDGHYERRCTITINWIQVMLYMVFLSYMGLSLYFFYIGLSAFAQFPASGTFSKLYPVAFQTSRLSSLVTICFAMVLLITGVLGKIGVRASSVALMIFVTLLQLGVVGLLTVTAVYAKSFLDQGRPVADLQLSVNDEKLFASFIRNIIHTAVGLQVPVVVGTLLTISLIVLLKRQRHNQLRRLSTSDTLELFQALHDDRCGTLLQYSRI